MTNERAIELLQRISDSQFDGIHGDERREALEMAVRTLEQNLVKESGGLVQDLVKDCISRQMAIEAFEPTHYKDWYTPTIIETLETLPSVRPEVLACGSGELVKESGDLVKELVKDCISRKMAIDAVVSAMIDGADAELVEGIMELLPSAQTHWIPCSERMPKEKDAGILKKLGTEKRSEYVLATVEVKGERMTVTACTYDGKWDWNMKYAFPDFKVVAWMPLPKSYEGADDE